MAKFNAIFVQIVGLNQREVGRSVELTAESRETAIAEAKKLWRPTGTNYLKITQHGQVVSWIALAYP